MPQLLRTRSDEWPMCCLLLFGARDSTWSSFTNRIFLVEAAARIRLFKRAASKVPRQHHFVKLLLGAGERDQLTVSFLGFASTTRYG